MTQAWIQDKALSLNFPAWSLSCEIFYYGLFPVLCPLVLRLRKKLKTGLPILTLILVPTWAVTGLQVKWGLYHPFTNLPLFLCGMMLATCQNNTKAYAAGLLIWVTGMLLLPGEQKKMILLNGYGAAPLFALLVLGASHLTFRSSLFMQILTHAGLWSYPFYLGQYFSALLTKYLYWQFFSHLLKGFDWRHIFWVNFFVAVGLTYGVEKPFEKIRKYLKKRLFFGEL
jgi:peptidoglycan/LPS O-acetylase OafA/YrhL